MDFKNHHNMCVTVLVSNCAAERKIPKMLRKKGYSSNFFHESETLQSYLLYNMTSAFTVSATEENGQICVFDVT